MNLALFSTVPAFLADIVVGPPPPPPDLVVGPLAGNTLASLGFWMFAIVAAAGLWWLRRRHSAPLDQPAAEPK